jgi:hypothetical protein
MADGPPKVTDFEKVRRDIAAQGKTSEWSVRDCLQHAIDRIDEGEINPTAVFIAFVQVPDDERATFPWNAAGFRNRLDVLGALFQHMHELAED